jgi:hypothetical protein
MFKALETEWDFEQDTLIEKNQIDLSIVTALTLTLITAVVRQTC